MIKIKETRKSKDRWVPLERFSPGDFIEDKHGRIFLVFNLPKTFED